MKRHAWIVLGSVALGIGCLGWMSRAEPAAARPADSEAAAPGRRVQILERQLEVVNARLARLEAGAPPVVVMERHGQIVPQVVPPSGWQRRQFNAMDYYLVPLEQSAAQAPASPQVPNR